MENKSVNKTEYQSQLFSNRLKKKYKEIRKWARKNRISCYRLFDRDIPEIPLSLDLYEFLPNDVTNPIETAKFLAEQNAKIAANDLSIESDIKERTYAILYLYERPYKKTDEEEEEAGQRKRDLLVPFNPVEADVVFLTLHRLALPRRLRARLRCYI